MHWQLLMSSTNCSISCVSHKTRQFIIGSWSLDSFHFLFTLRQWKWSCWIDLFVLIYRRKCARRYDGDRWENEQDVEVEDVRNGNKVILITCSESSVQLSAFYIKTLTSQFISFFLKKIKSRLMVWTCYMQLNGKILMTNNFWFIFC